MRQKIIKLFLRHFQEKLFLLHSGKEDRFSVFGIGIKDELSLFGKEKDILKNLYGFWQDSKNQELLINTSLPFQGGVFVFLSYDLIENFEKISLKNSAPQIPKVYAVAPEQVFVIDWKEEKIFGSEFQEGVDLSEDTFFDDLRKIPSFAGIIHLDEFQKNEMPPLPLGEGWGEGKNWSNQITKEEYKKKIQEIQKEIILGNTFQVNLSQKFIKKQNISSRKIFENLCDINPTPFSAYFETPFGKICSASPERLVSIKNRVLETKPIAGTRKRSTGEEDIALRKELHLSKKEMAEHSMIVDLERNDMGRVCDFGSVQVKKFAEVEQYSHVQHLVTTIQGNIKSNKNFCDVIQAMHPGGTITGCPKHETCKIISEFEDEDRGVYTGAIGYINTKGDMDLNILIRTIYAHNNILETQAGGGIVLDSVAEYEYKETLDKAKAQFLAGDKV